MGEKGQESSPQVQQPKIAGQNESEVIHLSTFPVITGVHQSDVSYTALIQYLRYKVDCFWAGQLRDYYHNWLTITSDAEILNTVSGQHIEFSQRPFQLFVPHERQN